MKNSILFFITIPFLILFTLEKTDTTCETVSDDILIDEDLFKREVYNAAMDAAKEFNIHPDSTYIPFKDELK